jgi:hypothetical protein
MSASEHLKERITSAKARLSYPYLFTPKAAQEPGEKDKYGTALIFEADVDTKPMREAAMRVATARWPDAPNLFRSGKLRWPFRNDPETIKEKGYPVGSSFINTNAGQNQPGVVDASLNDVTNPNDAYAGRYAFATLTVSTYDRRGNKGVTFYLNNVQILEHGERLDGRRSATDDFQVQESAISPLSDLGEEAVDAPAEVEVVGAEEASALSDLIS